MLFLMIDCTVFLELPATLKQASIDVFQDIVFSFDN